MMRLTDYWNRVFREREHEDLARLGIAENLSNYGYDTHPGFDAEPLEFNTPGGLFEDKESEDV